MTEKNWMDSVDDFVASDYIKFLDGDEKVLKIVSDPVAGPIEFQQENGPSKFNDGLKIEVLEDGSTDIKTWTITSKHLMAQLKAIATREGLGANIAGSTIRVAAQGIGMQRKYFVKFLSKPATRTDKDSGTTWIDTQKVGTQKL